MLILNTGGTFNKRYDSLTGKMEVPFDNVAIEKILSKFSYEVELAGVMYKDSLEMDIEDRKIIAKIIAASRDTHFIVVHGTDTMDLTAEFFSEIFVDRVIILTGSMVPFEIDPIEATSNLSLALGFAKSEKKPGIYIAMQGLVEPFTKIKKNKQLGKFELV